MGLDSADGPKKSRFSYDRLAELSLGSTNNGPHCRNQSPHNFSVWLLHHDSECGEVQRIAPSLAEWMEKAEPVAEDMDDV